MYVWILSRSVLPWQVIAASSFLNERSTNAFCMILLHQSLIRRKLDQKKACLFFLQPQNSIGLIWYYFYMGIYKNAIIIFSNKTTLIENQMSKCVSEANLPICDGPDNLQQISFYEVNSTAQTFKIGHIFVLKFLLLLKHRPNPFQQLLNESFHYPYLEQKIFHVKLGSFVTDVL